MADAGTDIAIVCAMKNEAHAARSIQGRVVPGSLSDCLRSTQGMLGSLRCLTVLLGFGSQEIQKSMEVLIDRHHPRIVLNFGAAGSLRNALPTGTPTVPKEVAIYDSQTLAIQSQISIPGVEIRPELADKIVVTKAGTCPQVICTAELRNFIAEKLHLDTTDCETGYIAEICDRRGVPFCALRCITDLADEASYAEYGRSARRILDNCAHHLITIAEGYMANLDGTA